MTTPKERYIALAEGVETVKGIVHSASFTTACDYALLQLQSEMTPNCLPGQPTDPYIGLDANAQMLGARRVIEILKTLPEPIEQKQPTRRPTLKYD